MPEYLFLRQLLAANKVLDALIEQGEVAELHRKQTLFFLLRKFREARRRRTVLQALRNHGLHLLRKAGFFYLALPEQQVLFKHAADSPNNHGLAALIHDGRELPV